jgi:hypothetical protein
MYYMTRTFDHAGYYETRLLLAILAIAVATWFWRKENDRNYWIMLLSGVFFQGALEWLLGLAGMRGADYSLTVFGLELRSMAAHLVQGVAEGGILCMMSYWFLDIVRRPRDKRRWRGYLAACGLIVILASTVGYLARGHEISSPRPMFGLSTTVLIFNFVLLAALVITWFKGADAFYYLGLWFAGCFVYVVLTFSTLQIWGARFIAERAADGSFVAASPSEQFWYMLYSHLFEVAGGKIHYFVIPFALGLMALPRSRGNPELRIEN